MSKKILVVDMPEYCRDTSDFDLMDYANHAIEFTEIHLPTEEEIMDIVRNNLILTMNDEPFASELIAKKILDKILNQ